MKNFEVIGFDADDTLWENQLYFDETEELLSRLLAYCASEEEVKKKLYEVEMRNMPIYKYGVKPYILSVIEAAIELSRGTITASDIARIIARGKFMLNQPVKLMKGVEKTLAYLQGHYKLVLVTKGDLLDQSRKLERSGLTAYFDHIEIMPDKTLEDYEALFEKLQIDATDFLMIGNSLRSDVLPVLDLGGQAIHIPCERTWQHEHVDTDRVIDSLASLDQLPAWLQEE